MRLFLLLIFTVLSIFESEAQRNLYHPLQQRKRVDIPFEFHNNFIIIDLVFDKRLPLKFIFDTGAEHTILAKKEIAEAVGMKYDRAFKLLGADLRTELVAYLTRNVHLKMGELSMSNLDILVLGEDYFDFEAYTGVLVHGILGANIFKRFVVRINYQKKVISFIHPNSFNPPQKFQELPISIERNKPYIQANVELQNQTQVPVKLLLDSGASLNLLLHNDTDSTLQLPERVIPGNIGRGLGGFLEGFLGRIGRLELGEEQFSFDNIVTSFQELSSPGDSSRNLVPRNGIIGNIIMSRFTVVIDYIHEKLYLKARKNYNKGFKYDKSGLVLIATGARLSDFIVSDVVKGSPAEQIDIRKDDRIIRLNWIPSGFLNLDLITRKLQGRSGKTVTLIIKRGRKRIKKKITLRDLI
ncbi:MAG: aspartyl protease family protein [Bacteroidota bacterium]